MNKSICKSCIDKSDEWCWDDESEGDWYNGRVQCVLWWIRGHPGKTWVFQRMKRYCSDAPHWCPYQLEHIVMDDGPTQPGCVIC